MAIIKVAGVKESDGQVFPTIPASQYPVRCANVEQRVSGPTSKHPGSPYLNLTLKVTGDSEHKGVTLWFMINLPNDEMEESEVQRAVASMRHAMDAFQLPVDSEDIDTQDFIGAEALAIVQEKTEDGIKKNNVRDLLPLKE
jgi:hypothetical protein